MLMYETVKIYKNKLIEKVHIAMCVPCFKGLFVTTKFFQIARCKASNKATELLDILLRPFGGVVTFVVLHVLYERLSLAEGQLFAAIAL